MSDPTGRSIHMLRVRLPAPISLAHLRFSGLTVRGFDLSARSLAARTRVGAILGYDVLARSRVTLDFAAGQAVFEHLDR